MIFDVGNPAIVSSVSIFCVKILKDAHPLHQHHRAAVIGGELTIGVILCPPVIERSNA